MKKSVLAALAFGLVITASAQAAEGDAVKGGVIYKTKCAMCHALDKNMIGPKSTGVVGRKAGSLTDYAGYSSGVKASGLVWDEPTLDKWLAGPIAMVPGAKMAFKLDNPQDRADTIAYLKTLK